MVVIKIGGSLQSTSYIKKWIKEIKINRNESFLLVFGGGKYAKYVRNEQKIKNYNDAEAHKLAIDAMKKFTNEELNAYLSKISDENLYAYNVYQIEGEGRNLFSDIEGDEDTIMGLPIKKLKEYLNSYK